MLDIIDTRCNHEVHLSPHLQKTTVECTIGITSMLLSKILTKHVNLCGQNVECLNLKTSVHTYTNC